jgi:CheY-like chemotaxis protein
VLVAEDEGLIMMVARMALEREGYLVLTAQDGEEALDVSRKFPGSIHALVADVRMPKMGGIELGKRIVAERPGIKVLLTSAFVDAPVQGCPFLSKPFHVSVLKERMRQLLASAA